MESVTRYISLLLFCLYLLPMSAQDKDKCKVALIQANLIGGDVSANLAAFDQRISQCKDCDLVILPELFTSGCEMKKNDEGVKRDNKDKIAADYPKVLEQMKQWAADTQALIIGSTVYKENDKYFNRLLAVFPDGSYQYYDKHNCFKKGGYSPGEHQLVIEWKGHKFGTYICYDLRFPEWSRNDNRYDTAIYIANWPESRRDDWDRLLKERAIENKAYIIAVNCVGKDSAGLMYAGDSSFISEEGEVLSICKEYQEEILFIDL